MVLASLNGKPATLIFEIKFFYHLLSEALSLSYRIYNRAAAALATTELKMTARVKKTKRCSPLDEEELYLLPIDPISFLQIKWQKIHKTSKLSVSQL